MRGMLPILAVISGSGLINLLITVVIGALIYFVVTWALAQFKIAEPFSTVVRVILVLLVAVFLINALLSLNGHGFISW